jgi:hypothetical protein
MSKQATQMVRIEYTRDSRNGTPSRWAKEVPVHMAEKVIAKLEDQGAYNFECKYESLQIP